MGSSPVPYFVAGSDRPLGPRLPSAGVPVRASPAPTSPPRAAAVPGHW